VILLQNILTDSEEREVGNKGFFFIPSFSAEKVKILSERIRVLNVNVKCVCVAAKPIEDQVRTQVITAANG